MLLADRIMSYAASLGVGGIVTARGMRGLADSAVLTRHLSALAAAGRLVRIARGQYVVPAQDGAGPVLRQEDRHGSGRLEEL